MSVIDSGDASSGDDSGRSLSRKESKGTIQFLNRLDHGLVTSGGQVISGKPSRIDSRKEGARGTSTLNTRRDAKPRFDRGRYDYASPLADVVERQQPCPQLEMPERFLYVAGFSAWQYPHGRKKHARMRLHQPTFVLNRG